MKKTSKKIIFFGTDDFSLVALQSLIDNDFNIVAVVTKPDSKSGRGQKLRPSSVKELALKQNIDVWQPTKVTDINDDIKKLGTDVVGVLSSYGKIIPGSTIEIFKPGIINIHPSLLPKYRGPSPVETAIKNGDTKTGVSIMLLETGMDSGPIYDQIVHDLSGHETGPELSRTLAQAGSDILVKLLPSILDGSLKPTPQNDAEAIYCSLISKEEAWLKPDQINASDAESIVRAHLGYPKTKLNVLGHDIIIKKAHVSDVKTSELDILCKDNKYLSIEELVSPSGRQMNAKDFINGYAG